MSATDFAHSFCIDAGHPALPGHFPGHPLVPGVMLLEQVAVALRAWHGQRLAGVSEAKFMAPLLPGQTAMVSLSETGNADARIRFEIRRDGNLLARGVVEGSA
jgi:3-hydroxymyristoyl/3-hydroxydecanoyl-(acyl carrier protein) dehydratase